MSVFDHFSPDALVYWDRDVVARGMGDEVDDDWRVAPNSDMLGYDEDCHWHWMVLEVYGPVQHYYRLYVSPKMSRFTRVNIDDPNEELHTLIGELQCLY